MKFPKKKKLKSISSLKKKAWKIFSEWIRRRDMVSPGVIVCITCGAKVLGKDANSSHFIHGHSKPTFFDPRNVHSSCIRCNLYLSGNLIEYSNFMKNKYGWETVDALRELSHQVIKFNRDYYEDIIERYGKKLEGLGGDDART